MSLREVTQENVRAVCELRVAESQRRLVAPAAYTVAEAAYEPDGWLRAIYLGEEPVGVLFVGLDETPPYLVRFMVDAAHQRRGVGRRAMDMLTGDLRAAGHTALEVSYVPADGSAEGFWLHCGFEHTGRTHEGEPVLILDL